MNTLIGATTVWMAFVSVLIWLNMLMVRYDVQHLFHRHLPLLAEFVIAIVGNGAVLAVTIITWLLVYCSVIQ